MSEPLAPIPTTYRFDVTGATVVVPVLVDGELQYVGEDVLTETVTRDLVYLIEKDGITLAEARAVFDEATCGQYPDAVATEYMPTVEQHSDDWTQGLATIIQPT